MKRSISPDFASSLGARLTELRKELKLHPRDMARKMGVSERVYRRYEPGEQVPGSDKLSSLLEDLQDVSPKWLLMGSGRMFKSLGKPEITEKILDIVASNPSIEHIVLMLKGLDEEDLHAILNRISEKKRLMDLHTELRNMMNKLERPAPEKGHLEKAE